ncbi:MAG: hypothetical protein WCV90_01395 [Candidatus Woesearchaeota archaeon]
MSYKKIIPYILSAGLALGLGVQAYHHEIESQKLELKLKQETGRRIRETVDLEVALKIVSEKGGNPKKLECIANGWRRFIKEENDCYDLEKYPTGEEEIGLFLNFGTWLNHYEHQDNCLAMAHFTFDQHYQRCMTDNYGEDILEKKETQ